MIRIGLLSTADIHRAHLAAVAETSPVVAVASRSRPKAEAFGQEHSIERVHGSYAELLADPELDAVVIALPNALHHEWTMRALAAGKHVLCEKPYTRQPHEAETAWDEAERRGLVLMEAFMWRHAAQTALMRELLPQLGPLYSVHAAFSFRWWRRDDDVRLVPELGGGSLLDVGCYCVSAFRLVAGEPDEAYGTGVSGRGGVDWGFAGVLRSSEVLGTLQCGFRHDERSLVVRGAGGELHAPDPWHASESRVYLNGVEHRAEPEDPYRRQLANFVAAIGGEAEPLLGREDAVAQARALDALWRAAASGRAVSL
ncbi:MAG TPA: Gfo/Idh/MocA family oxidoreductase [Gaiellaceae bacterium]|nr:Gfo/Idh/MocA family oxidoreductase [Gaiellaceae bacterium]